MSTALKQRLLLIIILALGAFLRLYNVNWDQGQHLHPDERFLTMVGVAMEIPSSFAQYLDPVTSSMNPANLNYTFFVYGLFPIVLNKIVSILLNMDTYAQFTLVGRVLSALADVLIIYLIYKTVQLWEKMYGIHKHIKFFAAFIYATAVLPIQLSHFFTVDPFLNLFLFLSFFFACKFAFNHRQVFFILSAVCLGLAMSSKISAIFFFPLLIILLVVRVKHIHLVRHKKIASKKHSFLYAGIHFVGYSVAALLIMYLTVRLTNPYMFKSASFTDIHLNKTFLTSIKTLQTLSRKEAWYPPGVQWIHKTPILFSLQNIFFFGFGVVASFFSMLGMYLTLRNWKRYYTLAMVIVWILLFFVYQSTQYVQTMRYFIILYPFLAIFAGIGFHALTEHLKTRYAISLLVLFLFWPLAFFSIYVQPQTRIAASKWMYQYFPTNTIVLNEHWDDPLPLLLPNMPMNSISGKQVPVFGPDNQEKWDQMQALLQEGDYYIMSSNRAWGSIPTVPERYPQMTAFYQALFAGALDFKPYQTFTSYPSLRYLGIPIDFPDDWAEEAFTVYDHPKVMIFRKDSQ